MRAPRLALALLVLLVVAAPAQAGPSSPRSAIVSLGDSYISGEAGRWQGNSINSAGDKDGTDRACTQPGPATCSPDKAKVYAGGTENGCHRSDVAEVLSAAVPVDEKINLSCSGAVADNIWRASQGGKTKHGEAPQADQLLKVAQERNVRMVLLSVGGNDLGFAAAVTACFQAYTAKTGPCRDEQQKKLDAAKPEALADVKKAIDEVRAVMAAAGYGTGDWRLVMQTYPAVIPRASEARYPETGGERSTYGCPFYDADLTWGRDVAAPQIGGVIRDAAAARGVEVLELIDALQGREICAKTTEPATPGRPPTAERSEWGRAVSASTIQQGETQELFHPNAFAQQALGACAAGVFASAPGRFRCTNTLGAGAAGMQVSRTGDVPAGTAPAAAPRRCRDGSPADRAKATPRRRGLRFALPRSGSPYRVDVFQQSTGRRIIGNRLVARFGPRTRSFSWSGRANRRGRRATDGVYIVRFRTGSDEGRLAVARRDGRFRKAPDYSQSPGCGLVRLFKLERPVFGGSDNRAIDVAVKLDRAADVRVRVLRGRDVLRSFRSVRVRAGRIVRQRIAAERLPRGELRVQLRVRVGGRTSTRILRARRL